MDNGHEQLPLFLDILKTPLSKLQTANEDTSFENRLQSYEKDHCWQYDIRLNNLAEDLAEHGLTQEFTQTLKVPDFIFKPVVTPEGKQELKEFIERHEWLGTLSQYTTHWFGCYLNKNKYNHSGQLDLFDAEHEGILTGVILFNMLNSFSKLLGEGTSDLERLISRGACISWSPKNLASSFLMWCIKWMVDNTEYRLFTAYSDPSAKELGTIYQACNFYYLGQQAGASVRYINPYTGKIVSDRFFRQRTAYKKYALELGIPWSDTWTSNTGMLWEKVPKHYAKQLRGFSKYRQNQAKKVILPKKHKYSYILGRDKRETKYLRQKFLKLNKTFDYPKERGI